MLGENLLRMGVTGHVMTSAVMWGPGKQGAALDTRHMLYAQTAHASSPLLQL